MTICATCGWNELAAVSKMRRLLTLLLGLLKFCVYVTSVAPEILIPKVFQSESASLLASGSRNCDSWANTALLPRSETIAHIPSPIPIRLRADIIVLLVRLVIRLLTRLVSLLDAVVAAHAFVRHRRPLPDYFLSRSYGFPPTTAGTRVQQPFDSVPWHGCCPPSPTMLIISTIAMQPA